MADSTKWTTKCRNRYKFRRRQSGNGSCEHINHRDPALNRQAGVARTFWGKTNRPPRTTESHAMHQQPNPNPDRQKDWRLRGNSQPAFLSKKEKRSGKVCE